MKSISTTHLLFSRWWSPHKIAAPTLNIHLNRECWYMHLPYKHTQNSYLIKIEATFFVRVKKKP